MFMSHGPSYTYRQKHRGIFERYTAADKFLTDEGVDSYQFNRQAGWLERVYVGDDRNEAAIGLRYHATHVYTMYANGDTSFDSGRWMTPSTAAWMHANGRFDVNLYEPRSGQRKPFRYPQIRFAGHDRNIERKLRDEWGLPTFAEVPHLWSDHYREYRKLAEPGHGELGVTHEFIITDPILHERAQYFRDELRRRQLARHPWYVYEDGITFSKRGRCGGQLLSDAIEQERAERAEIVAKRRSGFSAVRKITNKIMSALATGIPVESETAEQLVRVTATLPGDLRDWLNFHEREGEIVMGDLAPIVEPIIRRQLVSTLTRTYVPALD